MNNFTNVVTPVGENLCGSHQVGILSKGASFTTDLLARPKIQRKQAIKGAVTSFYKNNREPEVPRELVSRRNNSCGQSSLYLLGNVIVDNE